MSEPETSPFGVLSACRSATFRRTILMCNAGGATAMTYPIAIREGPITRYKTAFFSAEWLARILFAGRGYLERGGERAPSEVDTTA